MTTDTLLRGWLRRLGASLLWATLALPAGAVETDNFYLPAEPGFADVGDFLEAVHTCAIEQAVERINDKIERALKLKDPAARRAALERWHRPETLTDEVAGEFGGAPLEKARIEDVLDRSWSRRTFPEKTVLHRDLYLNMRGRILIDPRMLLMVVQAGTFKAYGVYLGTDKLVHFHQLGPQYYHRYRGLIRGGMSPEEARQNVVEHFAEKAVLAEGRGFGTFLTGVFSNADMAANYIGFKFMLNITEPVSIKGSEQPPLVVRCGVFWRVNDQVRLHSGWFRPFLSDHLNEALNPNLYDFTMRPHVKRILEERAAPIVEFYTAHDHRPDDGAYFEELAVELSTYYGEPYGHSGEPDKLMNLGNTCFPALPPSEVPKEQAAVSTNR